MVQKKPANDTRFDRFIKWGKNNRFISIILLIGLMVLTFQQFMSSAITIGNHFKSQEPLELSNFQIGNSELDLLVRNVGATTTIVHTAEVEILEVLEKKWRQPEPIGGWLNISATLHALIGPNNISSSSERDPVKIQMAVEIKPNSADRFKLRFRAGSEVVSNDTHGLTYETLLNAQGLPLKSIKVRARLKLHYNKEETLLTEPFEFIVGSTFAIRKQIWQVPVSVQTALRQLESDDFFEVNEAVNFFKEFNGKFEGYQRVIKALHKLFRRNWEPLLSSYNTSKPSNNHDLIEFDDPSTLKEALVDLATRLSYQVIKSPEWPSREIFRAKNSTAQISDLRAIVSNSSVKFFAAVSVGNTTELYEVIESQLPRLVEKPPIKTDHNDETRFEQFSASPRGRYRTEANYRFEVIDEKSGFPILALPEYLSEHGDNSWAVGAVDWSDDGRYLYFDNHGAMACIYEFDVEQRKLRKIIYAHEAALPVYFELDDRSYIAYVLNNTIRIAEGNYQQGKR